jgi:hypothetical protein
MSSLPLAALSLILLLLVIPVMHLNSLQSTKLLLVQVHICAFTQHVFRLFLFYVSPFTWLLHHILCLPAACLDFISMTKAALGILSLSVT